MSAAFDEEQYEPLAKIAKLEHENDELAAQLALATAELANRDEQIAQLTQTNKSACQHPATPPPPTTLPSFPQTPPTPNDFGAWLDVPFPEKDDAKGLGAKWDDVNRMWYMPNDVDAKPLARWDQASRTYLSCPYSAKEAAKNLGAMWDSSAKKWYVPGFLSIEPFKEWLPLTPEQHATIDNNKKRALALRAQRAAEREEVLHGMGNDADVLTYAHAAANASIEN